jgi:hypothetical protein
MKHAFPPTPRKDLPRPSFLHHIFPREATTPVPHLDPPTGRALTASSTFLGNRR